ncbi:hypothetical protein SO694_0002021 [Aureococcus anophagefferens]|uniref:Uncharacterized protein n=1 Tax=Aureococcus anophagefferens TaxID=44056 RepID=A0ABR1FTW5_AURAN
MLAGCWKGLGPWPGLAPAVGIFLAYLAVDKLVLKKDDHGHH